MYPLNDKDLDRLSREAAEQYDVESSATGWDLVEKRLGTEMPVKAEKERRRFLFWLFFIALTAGGGLFYMLGGTKSNTSIAQQKVSSATSSQEQATNHQEPSTSPVTAGQPVTSKTTASQTEKNTKDISANKPANNSSATGTDKTETLGPVTKRVRDSRKGVSQNNKVILTLGQKVKSPTGKNNQSEVERTGIAKTDPAVVDKGNNGKTEGIENNAENTTVNNDKTTVAPVTNEATAKKESTTDKKTPELTASPKKPVNKNSVPVKNPLEIGLLVGPDQSYVRFKAGDNTGTNFGLQVGYRFSNRWSVNTGIILEKKNYKANGSDFYPPKGNWANNVKMDAVDGDCNMYDIPVNVRYDLSYNNKRRFFVSTGVTSYLMHHQNYDYYYTHPVTGQEIKYHWGTDSSMNYLFSVLNLSVGYERILGKHFSLQAEPYLKIPLKGVGFGSMKLDSYGVFFSLKYKPGFGKKNNK